MSNQTAKRIEELNQLAHDECIDLPWPAGVIAGIEERGGYVDLTTGHIGRGDERVMLTEEGRRQVANRGGLE